MARYQPSRIACTPALWQEMAFSCTHRREDLEVLIPVSRANIAGLPRLEPSLSMPRVPVALLHQVWQASKENRPNEILFWFNFDRNRQVWNLDAPLQFCRPASVFPMDKADPLGTRALIDLHSHARLDPFFSCTDNKDEQGFRIFAVIGKVNDKPLILVRVGVYGNYWNIPADLVFELPGAIRDAYKGEMIYDETNIEEEDFQMAQNKSTIQISSSRALPALNEDALYARSILLPVFKYITIHLIGCGGTGSVRRATA